MKKKSLLYFYDHIEEIILFIMTAIMVAVIFMQVVMRYVFNNSLSWSEELGRYIFIWISWLGISIGARKGQHIKIEMLTDRLAFKSRHAVIILSELIVLVICFVLVYYGIYLVKQLLSIGAMSAPLGISQAWGYGAVPVGCAIMMMRCIQSIYSSVKKLIKGDDELQMEGGLN